MKKLFLILYILFQITIIYSQEIHFSQLSQTQLYANPAFSGIQNGPRAIFQFRNQYPKIGSELNSGFNTYYASYDQFLEDYSSGIGLDVAVDKYADNMYSKYHISGKYAFQAKFDRYQALRIGVSSKLTIQQLDKSLLRFYDQIDPINGFFNYIPTQEDVLDNYSQAYFNVDAGLLYFRNNIYIGASARNLLPNKNFYNNGSPSFQDIALSIQAGGVLWLNEEKRIAIYPLATYDRQYGYHKIVVNAILQYQMINFGLGARNNSDELESIIGLIGFNFNKIKFSYSYDIVTNQLSGYSGGTHELGIRLLLKGEDDSLSPNAHKDILFCPDFMKN